ncbi:MAG: hypothetical protein J6D21_09315, partial [Clostridia bacterium]|nr:hypothetical protein [Clostridia bacterium]
MAVERLASRFFLWRQKAQRKKLGKKERPCKELSLAAASEEPPRLQRASFLKKARPKITVFVTLV